MIILFKGRSYHVPMTTNLTSELCMVCTGYCSMLFEKFLNFSFGQKLPNNSIWVTTHLTPAHSLPLLRMMVLSGWHMSKYFIHIFTPPREPVTLQSDSVTKKLWCFPLAARETRCLMKGYKKKKERERRKCILSHHPN